MPVYCPRCRKTYPTAYAHYLDHPFDPHAMWASLEIVVRGEEPRPHETETWLPTWPGDAA